MKPSLVIGGAGFIGCNLAAKLAEQQRRVLVFDNLSRSGSAENLRWLLDTYGASIEFVEGDICHPGETLGALVDRADAVFHLAAQVAVTWSMQNPRADFEANALGTLNVLEAVRLSKTRPPLVYASTNKVYGNLEDITMQEGTTRWSAPSHPNGIDEERPLDFHSPYGCSKGAADQYVRDYARVFGLRTVVCRQSCIFGRHQFGVEDQGWVAHFIISSYFGRPLTVFGDGKQVRDVLWVDDLIDFYLRAVKDIDRVSGEVFNLGGGPANTVSLLELVEELRTQLGVSIDLSFGESRPGDQHLFVCDVRKAKRLLNWEPSVGVRDGVKAFLAWLKANETRFAARMPAAAGPGPTAR